MRAGGGMKPVEALDRLRQIGLGYAISQTFFTGCTLGVFDQLNDGPLTAEEVGARLDIHPEGCRRLLVALHHIGLLEREADRYRNSELGSFLTSKSSFPMAGLARIDVFYHMWEFLPDALRGYGPVWQKATGATAEQTFAELYKDPVAVRRFCDYIHAYSVAVGQQIAAQFDFTPHRCLLDVAGGSGLLSQQIGLRYPHLRGIVMDLPVVLELAQEFIARNGLKGRFTTAAADLFAGPYPAGADVITLSWILHDWSDESCRKILCNCFEALPSGGVLLVSESVLQDDFTRTLSDEVYSLFMLLVCEVGARERTGSEHRALLEETGFAKVEIRRSDGPRDLMVARKR